MASLSNRTALRLYSRNAAIARIVSSIDDTHVGMGIVIGPRHVLTCAHVVNQALGLDDEATLQPKDSVLLEFPMLPTHSSRVASVSLWHPVDRAGRPGDVAVLSLGEHEADIDAGIGEIAFADVTGRSMDDDPLSVYAVLQGERTGEHVKASFVGFARGSLVQVESIGDKGRLIRPGFSGAAVFDEREQAVVGMVQGVKVDSHRPAHSGTSLDESPTAALILQAQQIAQLVPNLPLEVRARAAWYAPVWSLTAMALLVFSFAHIWVTQQGKGWIAQLALEPRHPQIAALYGMHLIALLGLGVAWLLHSYACDFSRSHWSQRVPPFPLCRDRWAPGPRHLMSTLVIALFVLVPIYAQGHLLRKFHGEGRVYAHVGTFGPQAWSAPGPRACIEGDFCEHPDAQRYSVVRAAPGAPGGYLNYTYKYGEPREGLELTAVTFFPILQPGLIVALNAWAIMMLVGWARLLRRPADRATWPTNSKSSVASPENT